MNDKLDENKYIETILELDSLMSENNSQTPDCPDEILYWSFLDYEDLASEDLKKHFVNCKYCRQQLALVSKAIAGESVDSIPESRRSNEIIEKKLGLPPILSIHIGEMGLSTLLNSFVSTQPYRSAKQENIAFAEQTDFGIFEFSFIQSERKEFVEFLVRINKPKKARENFAIELRREANILRSLPLLSEKWSSVAQWPRGSYKLVVTSSGVDRLTIEIRLV